MLFLIILSSLSLVLGGPTKTGRTPWPEEVKNTFSFIFDVTPWQDFELEDEVSELPVNKVLSCVTDGQRNALNNVVKACRTQLNNKLATGNTSQKKERYYRKRDLAVLDELGGYIREIMMTDCIMMGIVNNDKDRMTVDLNKMKKEIEKTKLSDMEQNEAQRDLQRCMNVPVKSDRLTEYILSDEHLAEAIIRPIMNEVLNVKPGVENPKHPSHKPTYSPLKAMICLVTSMVRNGCLNDN